MTLVFIQAGNPMQNGYVERCNGNIRKELLNEYIYILHPNRGNAKAAEWMLDYNQERPHKSLGYVRPKYYNPYPIKLET